MARKPKVSEAELKRRRLQSEADKQQGNSLVSAPSGASESPTRDQSGIVRALFVGGSVIVVPLLWSAAFSIAGVQSKWDARVMIVLAGMLTIGTVLAVVQRLKASRRQKCYVFAALTMLVCAGLWWSVTIINEPKHLAASLPTVKLEDSTAPIGRFVSSIPASSTPVEVQASTGGPVKHPGIDLTIKNADVSVLAPSGSGGKSRPLISIGGPGSLDKSGRFVKASGKCKDFSIFCNEGVAGSVLLDNAHVTIPVDAKGAAVVENLGTMERLDVHHSGISTASTPAPMGEPIPPVISIALPASAQLSKSDLSALAKESGTLATQLRVCLVDNKASGLGANVCNSVNATFVADLRNGLRNKAVTIVPLQDAVRRMERGATEEELSYVASILDLLSQKFAELAQK